MEVKVSEETYNFYLALDEWTPVVGHEVKVGEFKFAAIPNKEQIIILEVTSGAFVQNIPMDILTFILTSTKEKAVDYLKKVVGETLKQGLEKNDNVIEMITQMREKSLKRLGEMPPIYEVDIEAMLIKENRQLH